MYANRGSPPAILLRESYREAGKTKNRTLANLSDWPSQRIELFRAMLRGDKLAPVGDNGFEIRRSLPHGHVLAALTVARRIGLDDLLSRRAPNAGATRRWLSSLPGCSSIWPPNWPYQSLASKRRQSSV
jgi:hypothetical protein